MVGRDRSFGDIVAGWAERQPDAPALVAEGLRPMTYAALAAAMGEFRTALNAAGYGRGDRIAIVHPGGADMAAAIACLWGAAAAAPLNPELTADELAIALRDLGIAALLTDRGTGTPAETAERAGIPILTLAPKGDGVAGSIALRAGREGKAAQPGPTTIDDVATILTTSGTTSRSKVVPLHQRVMLGNYAGYGRALELTPADRCLSLMPMFHSHGINPGLGLNLAFGASAMFLRPFDIATFARLIATMEPTWYTGAYTFHHQILAHAERLKDAVAQSRLRFGRTGSGALDAKTAVELEAALGLPIVQGYASTETGVIAINPQPPRPRKPASVGLPIIAGACVVDEQGEPAAPGVNGEVVLPPASVFAGYEGDADATAEAFRGGWYHTGDRGYLDEDGYLFLTGRIKELINRGGEKIAPFEVEAALMQHPDVRAAVAFPMPHPTLGEEVAAAIVAAPGAAPQGRAIAAWLRGGLADFKIPRRFVFVDEIPKSATGRVVRRQLAAALGLDKPSAPRREAAAGAERFATALEAQLQDIWAETLGLDTVGLDEDFFDLGGDSLKAMELFLQIEAALGRRLPSAILFEAATVEAMAKRIAEYEGSPCLVPVQPSGDRPPLFVVHGSDGNAVYFRNLARHLGPAQPVYAFQSVGLDGREQPLTRIEDIVERYLPELRAVQPHGPYYLAGFSFGGRVAYTMAQRLHAAGEAVALLAMLDTFAATGGNIPSFWDASRLRLREARRLGWRALPGYAAARLPNVARVLAMRLPQPVYAYFRGRAGGAGAQAVPRSLRLAPLEAHAMANRAFRPRPYDGDIVLFKADRTPSARHDGWARLVRGRLEVRELPGGHTDILAEPRVRVLARELCAVLAERQKAFAHAAEADRRKASAAE